jgi:glycosyltransferase involved in cell wall biosynthesis
MRILVLTFFYRPDLSAGAFRAPPLVEALRALAPAGSQVDVVTSFPNRYHSFSAEAPETETVPGHTIVRIPLPAHRSGMRDQSRVFLAFARGAMRAVAGRDYDVVVATSGRLMTAVLGAWIAWRKRARLYLDIRDIFVETISDVLPGVAGMVVKPVFSLLECWTVRRADKVNLVSPGFEAYFRRRYPRQDFAFFTNGIDEEFLSAAPAEPGPVAVDAGRPVHVLYAGNLGESQGLHAIIPPLAARLGSRVRFTLIGDGGRRARLEAELAARRVGNVEVLPPVRRGELLAAYRAADVLFLHLHDYAAFRKVLPSKVFEYAAMGKPVWAGVAGYCAEFLRSEVPNAAIFPPCDVDAAERSFGQLTLQTAPRTDFVAKYARANISRALAQDILAVAGAA